MKRMLIKTYRELQYLRHNKLAKTKLKLKDREGYFLLKQNKEFKDIHNGERCFVFGNGPSVKDVDLSLLTDEIVFTVNQAARIPGFEKLNTNYHFWADANFFKKVDDEGSMELLEVMSAVNTGTNKPVVFFPLEQRKFLKEYGLDRILNARYFKTGVQMYESFDHEFDYSTICMGFCTVVQWCVTMAIYMGCTEIYLLGCDNTGLMATFKSALKQIDDSDYVYHVTENEKKRMENLLNYQSIEVYIESYLKNVKEYRYLTQYCKKRGISLVNCSSTTVIDSVPRMRLDDVVNKFN